MHPAALAQGGREESLGVPDPIADPERLRRLDLAVLDD